MFLIFSKVVLLEVIGWKLHNWIKTIKKQIKEKVTLSNQISNYSIWHQTTFSRISFDTCCLFCRLWWLKEYSLHKWCDANCKTGKTTKINQNK